MAYVPTRSDATAVATDMAARITTAGVAIVSKDTTVAVADSILCASGLQQQTELGVTAGGTTTSTSYAAVPNLATVSFTAPIGKVYPVSIDGCYIFQSVIGGSGGINFRVVNNTNGAVGNALSWVWSPPGVNVRARFSARTPLTMQAGVNVLQLQWRVVFGGDTGNVDSIVSFAFTVGA